MDERLEDPVLCSLSVSKVYAEMGIENMGKNAEGKKEIETESKYVVQVAHRPFEVIKVL